jgi:hypothetical protein
VSEGTRPSRDTRAGERYLALRALAKRTHRTTDELLQLYALEGFLARCAVSEHRERLVLKGGMLLAAFDLRRPTRDVDLLALRTPNETEAIRLLIAHVAAVELDDGLRFDGATATAESIREGEQYAGVRVRLEAALATARQVFHVDVNVGDPVVPRARVTALPRLLDDGTIELHAYPLTMVVAEKLLTTLERGTTNTRWRDFADLYLILQGHSLHHAELLEALREVARFRAVEIVPLSDALAGYAPLAQPKWAVWRRKQGMEAQLPGEFAEVVGFLAVACDPTLREAAGR